ncbi:threonylcarbamoyl-AMP synthase [bacterium]|nr:threonylcarbamoyl-AMP synthase [bacterium]
MTVHQPEIRKDILAGTTLAETVERLKQGGVIAYPTETVYGLGVDPDQPEAVRRLFQLKGRSPLNPVSLLIPSIDRLKDLTHQISARARVMMDRYWPGPLTLLFSATRAVPESVTGGTGRIGVRISGNPFCAALLVRWGGLLVSTSANPSLKPPAMTAAEVCRYFRQGLSLVLDGGRADGMPSTVLDVSVDPPCLIREGSINRFMIEAAIGPIEKKQ